MGFWGMELYQNDLTLDIKEQVEELFYNGKSMQEITRKLITEYACIKGNHIEESMFWFALADTQWNLGVLLPSVKEQAFRWIRDVRNMQSYQAMCVATDEQPKKVLENLQAKLSSPPPVKKPKRKKLYTCSWKQGDVFAYALESELAKEKGFYGRYFLIQKIDDDIWNPGHIIPIVYIKITKDSKLPSNPQEYNALEYVQTWFSKYEERFFPINMSNPQEDIAQKSKIHYEIDEYGFLPQFRAKLVFTSDKAIPSKLIYLGNFTGTVCPEKEFIPHTKTNIISVTWNTFEAKMIERYCDHNLRELSIYSK